MNPLAREGSVAAEIEAEFYRLRPKATSFDFPIFYARTMRGLVYSMGTKFPKTRARREMALLRVLRDVEAE